MALPAVEVCTTVNPRSMGDGWWWCPWPALHHAPPTSRLAGFGGLHVRRVPKKPSLSFQVGMMIEEDASIATA